MNPLEKISQKNPEIPAIKIPLFFRGFSKKFKARTAIKIRLRVLPEIAKCIRKLV